MAEALELLGRKDQALSFWAKHSEASKMFCKDWDLVICQNWILEKTHRDHEITNLPEKVANLKSTVFAWKDKVQNLHSFALSRAKELRKLRNPRVEQLEKFRDAVIKALQLEIDKAIESHKQLIPEIDSVAEKVNDLMKCWTEQGRVLSEKVKVGWDAQSYAELKKYVKSVKNPEGAQAERGDYKAEIKEYLALTEEKQRELEEKFTKDFSVGEIVLKQRWPETKDFMKKLVKTMCSTSQAYLDSDV